MSILKITNLRVSVEEREIVKGVGLEVKTGEIHVVMGPNGSGKSSLALAIAGYPRYKQVCFSKARNGLPITNYQLPKITIDGEDVTKVTSDERARKGIFLSFQNPVAIPGVGVSSVLRMVKNNGGFGKFYDELKAIAKSLGLGEDFLRRPLNEDMSGGEKKKMELLQALVLEPKFIIFDEIDTGLDVDALRMIGEKINTMRGKIGIIIITHYPRILRYVKPDFVHVMIEGKFVADGGLETAKQIEKIGYKSFES